MMRPAATVEVETEDDVVLARMAARELVGTLEFSITDKTRVATAVSELARNVVLHGCGGTMEVSEIANGPRLGVRIVFNDDGPGIRDIDEAMRDGYSSCGSLGLGLPGCRRLMDDFHIESEPGKGTRVEIVKWK